MALAADDQARTSPFGLGDAVEKARKRKPDLMLLDVAPRTNGIVVASVLKDMMPNVRIVLFTM
jgi:YesN/AraC family two-component response regulator